MPKPTLAGFIAGSLRAQDVSADDGGLLAFAARFARARNPKWCADFSHLAPIAEGLEEAFRCYKERRTKGIKQVSHAAVQHGKTTLLQAFVLWCLRQDPHIRIGYGSFNNERAEDKMWQSREVAHRLGIDLNPRAATKTKWYTEKGGFVYAGGVVGGTWTGDGLDIIVTDDLYKGKEEADSGAWRAKVEGAFDDVIMTRGQDWTSWIVNMARWNPQDLSGVLIRRGWPYVCLPAIDEEGRALWPSVVSLEKLLTLRDGDLARGIAPIPRRTWWSLYQGRPRDEEGKIFDVAHLMTYASLPESPYVEGGGLDLAYGAKRQNDRSAYTVFRRYASDPRRLYRVECHSAQQAIELYAMRVAEVQLRRGGLAKGLPIPRALSDAEPWVKRMTEPEMLRARRVPFVWYTSTTEEGTARILVPWGAKVEARRAGVDKLARAQGNYAPPGAGGYTAAWAEGRIVVPAVEDQHGERWRISHEDFTGLDGCEDDEVDGAVAAHDKLAVPSGGPSTGGARTVGGWAFGSREG